MSGAVDAATNSVSTNHVHSHNKRPVILIYPTGNFLLNALILLSNTFKKNDLHFSISRDSGYPDHLVHLRFSPPRASSHLLSAQKSQAGPGAGAQKEHGL